MKTLISIDDRYEDKDESANIRAMELVKSSTPTEYDRKTLRNYISVWSTAYRILLKSRAEYDDDKYIQEELKDCEVMDDVELGFHGIYEDYKEVSGPYHFSIWFGVGGYWDEVMDIAIGLYNQGILLEVRDVDDILEFLRKDYLVGFRPCPDKYMNRDGVKVQKWLPHIGDVSKDVYWKIIRATSWHKEPEVRPIKD